MANKPFPQEGADTTPSDPGESETATEVPSTPEDVQVGANPGSAPDAGAEAEPAFEPDLEERWAIYHSAKRQADKWLAQREEDGAAYAMDMPEIADAFERAGDDPAARLEAVERRWAAQLMMQIQNKRVLSKPEAAGIEADILRLPAAERAAALSKMRDDYGRNFSKAFGELSNLDGRNRLLLDVLDRPALTDRLAQVLEAGAATGDGLDPARTGATRDEVARRLRPWLADQDPTARPSETQSAIEDLALAYLRDGLYPEDAAWRAVNAVPGANDLFDAAERAKAASSGTTSARPDGEPEPVVLEGLVRDVRTAFGGSAGHLSTTDRRLLNQRILEAIAPFAEADQEVARLLSGPQAADGLWAAVRALDDPTAAEDLHRAAAAGALLPVETQVVGSPVLVGIAAAAAARLAALLRGLLRRGPRRDRDGLEEPPETGTNHFNVVGRQW